MSVCVNMYYAAACSYKHTFVRRILVILGAKISCQADQISLQDLSRRPDRGGIEGAFLLGSGAATTPAVPLRSMPHSHVVIGGDGQAADGARPRHAPWIGATLWRPVGISCGVVARKLSC